MNRPASKAWANSLENGILIWLSTISKENPKSSNPLSEFFHGVVHHTNMIHPWINPQPKIQAITPAEHIEFCIKTQGPLNFLEIRISRILSFIGWIYLHFFSEGYPEWIHPYSPSFKTPLHFHPLSNKNPGSPFKFMETHHIISINLPLTNCRGKDKGKQRKPISRKPSNWEIISSILGNSDWKNVKSVEMFWKQLRWLKPMKNRKRLKQEVRNPESLKGMMISREK